MVRLSNNGKTSCKLVHRLVAETYIPNPHNLPEVNHKDCNKENNNVSNLEWVTSKQNGEHAAKYLLLKRKRRNKSKAVQQLTRTGTPIVSYFHISDAACLTNICHQNISAACRHKLQTAGGFKWQYA
jgi:hypothetical protein